MTYSHHHIITYKNYYQLNVECRLIVLVFCLVIYLSCLSILFTFFFFFIEKHYIDHKTIYFFKLNKTKNKKIIVSKMNVSQF